MVRGIESINLNSANTKKLADFYIKQVGLKLTDEFYMGEDEAVGYYFEFATGSTSLMIVPHSKVTGKNKNPERMFFNLEVDDIKKEVAKLKKAKVKVIADTYHIESYGWVATFEDVDGNYFQLVQVREN